MNYRTHIEILILLDGHQHGLVYYPAVPRVGDFIEVRIEGEIVDCKVLKVLWRRQTMDEFGRGECNANLYVERADKVKKKRNS